jgi:type IV pilus assembly protein PilC
LHHAFRVPGTQKKNGTLAFRHPFLNESTPHIGEMISNCFHAPGERRRSLIALARGLASAFAERQKLPAAFLFLSKQLSCKKLSSTLFSIAAELQGGRPAAEAFAGREKIFGVFFCQTAAHGMLSEKPGLFFLRLADFLETDERFRKKMASVLKYPFLLVAGTTGAMITVLAFIIPEAVRTISAVAGKLPMPTQIALNVFSASQPLLLLLPASFVILFACAWYSNRVFHLAERCASRVPFLGDFCRKVSLRRTASGISFFLSNGIGIHEALEIAAAGENRTPLRTKLLHAAQEIRCNRAPFITALKDADGIFPPSVFNTSSNAHDLEREDMLFRKIADFYEEEIEAGLAAAILIIEPAIVAIAGLVGGGILAALYLPLLRISNCR